MPGVEIERGRLYDEASTFRYFRGMSAPDSTASL
jgi:hypothetical protein